MIRIYDITVYTALISLANFGLVFFGTNIFYAINGILFAFLTYYSQRNKGNIFFAQDDKNKLLCLAVMCFIISIIKIFIIFSLFSIGLNVAPFLHLIALVGFLGMATRFLLTYRGLQIKEVYDQ